MRDFLLISHDFAQGPVSASVIRDGVRVAAPAILPDLAAARALAEAGGLDIVLLLPGALATVYGIDLPAGGERAARTAAPFLLEDRIAQPIETQHVALSQRVRGVRRRAAVIDRSLMESIAAALRDAGIPPVLLVPEHGALAPAEGEALLVAKDGIVLVACGNGLSFALEPDLWRQIAPALLQDAGIERLVIAAPTPADLLPEDGLATGMSWEGRADTADDLILSGLLARRPPSLLQGSFRTRIDWRAQAAPFRLAAMIAAIALPLHAGLVAFEGIADQKAADKLRQAAETRLVEAVPTTRRIVNPLAQMDAAIGAASARGGDFLLLAGHAFEAVAASESASIASLRYDGRSGVLDLELDFAAIDDIGAMSARLKAADIGVREGNMRSDAGRFIGMISLELPR